jgi:hypothetical protein
MPEFDLPVQNTWNTVITFHTFINFSEKFLLYFSQNL